MASSLPFSVAHCGKLDLPLHYSTLTRELGRWSLHLEWNGVGVSWRAGPAPRLGRICTSQHIQDEPKPEFFNFIAKQDRQCLGQQPQYARNRYWSNLGYHECANVIYTAPCDKCIFEKWSKFSLVLMWLCIYSFDSTNTHRSIACFPIHNHFMYCHISKRYLIHF